MTNPELVKAMRKALADTFVLYFKAHSFHWNVEGELFKQWHAFFGDIYSEMHTAVDDLAEHIRTLEEYAPASLKEIIDPSTITFNGIPTASSMVSQLSTDNKKVMDALNAACALAIAEKNNGLQDFLQARVDSHAKLGWMLRVSLK